MKWQNVKLSKRAAIVCATLIVASGTVLPGLTVSAEDGSASSSSVSAVETSKQGSSSSSGNSSSSESSATSQKDTNASNPDANNNPKNDTTNVTTLNTEKISKYATVVNGNYTAWQSFSWDGGVSLSKYSNQTLRVTELVKHSNGSDYYLLTTTSGQKVGYVNAKALNVTANAQGTAKAISKYVTITRKGYTVWGNLSWTSKLHFTSNLYHHTVQAKYAYYHSNGTVYYSLYQGGKWLGYLNENATKSGSGSQGAAITDNSYVTIMKKGYNVWGDFGWKSQKHSTSNWYHHTLQVKYVYYHANGGKYYSLYQNGKWFGYLNANAVNVGNGAQGAAISTSESVTLKGNYTIWRTFSWQKQSKQSGSYKNQQLKVKCYYNHANGDRYDSLYTTSGKWVGYVNSNGVSKYVAPKQYTGAFWLKPSENKPYPNLKKYPNAYFSVSQKAQRVYIKAANGKTLYTMICSTGLGNNTPNGWYKIQAERGTAFSGANYWTSWLNHGQYLFHTVIVNHDRSYNVAAAKKLGHKASHGCIRLPVPDAIWIYKNAPVGMRVHIY
jgi:lipoprotein-anchoring transpeptidase ErfK/SrfK